MLLQALVACAGVTLTAAATALGVKPRSDCVTAVGDVGVRGMLGIEKDVTVDFKQIRPRVVLGIRRQLRTSKRGLRRLSDALSRLVDVHEYRGCEETGAIGDHVPIDACVRRKAPSKEVVSRLRCGFLGAIFTGAKALPTSCDDPLLPCMAFLRDQTSEPVASFTGMPWGVPR